MPLQSSGEIRCRAPFLLRHSLAFLDGFGPMEAEQSTGGGILRKGFLLDGQTALVEVEQQTSGALDYRLFADRPLHDERRWVDRLRGFLTTDEDLAPFAALAARDDRFAPLHDRLRGFHHVTFPTAFEAACWGTLNQRVGFTVARRMKAAITRALGGRITVDGATHFAFPEPPALAAAGEERLAELVRHGRKAKTLAALAHAFTDGSEGWLRAAPVDEAERWLRAIHGVGPFTSAFVLFRGLGRFVRLPVAAGLIEAAERLYRRPFSTEKLLALAAGYGPWAGHFALYLWRSTFDA